MFGHFEKPVFLMLCKHTEILTLPAGAFLFKIGNYLYKVIFEILKTLECLIKFIKIKICA